MEESVKRCISTTNIVIQKWKDRKFCVTEDDVYQILLGYLRKWVCVDRMNFKHLKKRIIVHIDFNTKYIESVKVAVADIEQQSYQSTSDVKIRKCAEILESLKYEEYYPSNNTPEVLEIDYPQQISLESIKNIKF